METHEGHKIIRDPAEKLYGKILTQEPQVGVCAKRFCDRLNLERDAKTPLNLSHACLSLAMGMLKRSHLPPGALVRKADL